MEFAHLLRQTDLIWLVVICFLPVGCGSPQAPRIGSVDSDRAELGAHIEGSLIATDGPDALNIHGFPFCPSSFSHVVMDKKRSMHAFHGVSGPSVTGRFAYSASTVSYLRGSESHSVGTMKLDGLDSRVVTERSGPSEGQLSESLAQTVAGNRIAFLSNLKSAKPLNEPIYFQEGLLEIWDTNSSQRLEIEPISVVELSSTPHIQGRAIALS